MTDLFGGGILDNACKKNTGGEITADGMALCHAHGINMFEKPGENGKNRRQARMLGAALTPHPWPLFNYIELFHFATPLNMRLLDDISCFPEAFLYPALEEISKSDHITRELLKMCKTIYKGNRLPKNEVRAMITRNDFMIDKDTWSANQIEINTMAASFGGMATEVEKVQEYILEKHVTKKVDKHMAFRDMILTKDIQQKAGAASSKLSRTDLELPGDANGDPDPLATKKRKLDKQDSPISSLGVRNEDLAKLYSFPNNPAGFGKVFAAVRTAYEEQFYTEDAGVSRCPAKSPNRSPSRSPNSVAVSNRKVDPLACLFISDTDEKNEMDHRKMEMGIYKEAGLISFRLSFGQCDVMFKSTKEQNRRDGNQGRSLFLEQVSGNDSNKDGSTRLIFEEGEHRYEICVIYFRSGYWPAQFGNSEKSYWPLRAKLEQSRACKIPNGLCQLAGMKKIQQLLCEKDDFLQRKFPKYFKGNQAMISEAAKNRRAKRGDDRKNELALDSHGQPLKKMDYRECLEQIYGAPVRAEWINDMYHTCGTRNWAKDMLSKYFAHQFDPFDELQLQRKQSELPEVSPHLTLRANLAQLVGAGEPDVNWLNKGEDGRWLKAYAPQIHAVLCSGNDYVMKSQIEGSGSVIFAPQMVRILGLAVYNQVRVEYPELKWSEIQEKSVASDVNSEADQDAGRKDIVDKANTLNQFIIMKKINAPVFPSIVVDPKEDRCVTRGSVGELGIYGGFVANKNGCEINASYGHLLRSKGHDTQQGGVFMGHACVDAPLLF